MAVINSLVTFCNTTALLRTAVNWDNFVYWFLRMTLLQMLSIHLVRMVFPIEHVPDARGATRTDTRVTQSIEKGIKRKMLLYEIHSVWSFSSDNCISNFISYHLARADPLSRMHYSTGSKCNFRNLSSSLMVLLMTQSGKEWK